MLLTNNEIKHICKEISCNVFFADKDRKKIYTHLIEDYNTIRPILYRNGDSGVFIHTDCHKYLKLK